MAGISELLSNFYPGQKHIAVVDFSVCVCLIGSTRPFATIHG